jgi:hypothetical protein
LRLSEKSQRLLLFLVVIALAVMAVQRVSETLDANSLLPHHAQAYIYFSGDWLIGESKNCDQVLPLIHLLCPDGALPDEVYGGSGVWGAPRPDAAPEPKPLYDRKTKQWDDARFHSVRVKFFGDPTVNDPNRLFLTWHCERRDSDFKCWRIH